MKKLETLDKVVEVPDTTFYGAFYYDGEDIELCDDEETVEEGNESTYIHVKDTIKDGILYKEKTLKVKRPDGRCVVEETKSELPLDKDDMLIYIMYEGFVKTRTKMIPIDKAIERYELLKSPNKEE